MGEEAKQRAETQCEGRVERAYNELHAYQRQQRIESDKAECLEIARTVKDVSVEGCMDRRAKEWPLP